MQPDSPRLPITVYVVCTSDNRFIDVFATERAAHEEIRQRPPHAACYQAIELDPDDEAIP